MMSDAHGGRRSGANDQDVHRRRSRRRRREHRAVVLSVIIELTLRDEFLLTNNS
jgi:hypothetical protein